MRRRPKEYAAIITLLIITSLAFLPNIMPSYGLTELNVDQVKGKGRILVEDKFERGFWEKIQELKVNGTTENLSVIVRLVRDQRITGMPIEELKNYTASLLQSSHSATVYYKGKVLPVIMAKIQVTEVEKAASYDFVESLGDGDKILSAALDVSRAAIEADDVENDPNLGYNGSGITIAILDSGINGNHPDLNDLDDNPATNDPKVIHEISFVDWNDDGVPDEDPTDYHGHGTHVAGIAAGTGEALDYQYVGVAPGAWLMNVKVLNHSGYTEADDAVAGIDWAASRDDVDVISMSFGFRYDWPEYTGDGTSQVSMAADDAVDAGKVVVVAAGNEGWIRLSLREPADAFNVITVGASDDNNTVNIADDTLWNIREERLILSSRGPTVDGRTKPDVLAPGVDIMSTSAGFATGDDYVPMSGTSMATPHVSGTAALLLQAHPDWTPNQVKDALKRTARLNADLTNGTYYQQVGLTENDRGKGIIDAFAAVQASPDGTLGWDPYQVRSRDKATVVYNVTRVENVPSLRNIQLYGIQIANMTAAPYLWLAGQEHKLNDSLLISGPRVFAKTPTSADLRIVYRVDGVKFTKTYFISKIGIQSYMGRGFIGSFDWLGYYDLDLHGPDHDYAMWTNGSIIWNEAELNNTVFHYNNTRYFQPWIRFNSVWDAGIVNTNWILRYHGGFSNNPDNYKNNESIYDTNLVIYQKTGTSGWSGLFIEVIMQDMALPNKSFEDIGDTLCEVPPWQTDGGWRDLREDVNFDDVVDILDVGAVAWTIAIGGYNVLHDMDCDGDVDTLDLGIVAWAMAIGKTPVRIHGDHSWYTSGGGDYNMTQELDNDTIQAIAGHTVMFSFCFYPESVASDGSQNNARAEIYYEYSGGSNTVNGTWIAPSEKNWWTPYVIASLPSNITAVEVIIHGTPNFKAWVDLAQLYLIQ